MQRTVPLASVTYFSFLLCKHEAGFDIIMETCGFFVTGMSGRLTDYNV